MIYLKVIGGVALSSNIAFYIFISDIWAALAHVSVNGRNNTNKYEVNNGGDDENGF